MLEQNSKTLFFIKNPESNLAAVELYLKKRGFDVYSQTDLKTALFEIMKLNPGYIFIAWDNADDRIQNIPKIILQSMMTTIITYCTSNDKNQIRKLQSNGHMFKLFPPLSGPAIQRLVLKLEKENNAEITIINSKKTNIDSVQHPSGNQMIKSNDKNTDIDQFLNSLHDSTHKPTEIYIDKGHRAQQLRSQQSPQKNSNVTYLSPVQEVLSSTEKKMTDSMKRNFDSKFQDNVQGPMIEMIETFNDVSQNESVLALKNKTLLQASFGFCIVIESLNWNGYLIAASESTMDATSLEIILTNWITDNLGNETLDQNITTIGFEIDLEAIPFEKFSDEFAQYSKTILFDQQKTVLSFFSASPDSIDLRLHDEHDMFEIRISEVPISLPVPFDLHLYLPENKKFIMYCKKDSLVAAMQIDRLIEKKVSQLYSPVDFEKSIRQFRVKKIIRNMIDKFKENQKNNA